ncbi:hypothetical protein [Sorangium sp. So ce131]|uniref:hypothetical protein n=1 Tax=Sorangium sp. So ce131 TaxID=3133282 RepID=UPI003F630812
MDELEAGERRLLDALREADEPTDDDRRRMRAAVWARLGLAGTAATAVAASATSAAEAGVAGATSAAEAGVAGATSAAEAGVAGATSAAAAAPTVGSAAASMAASASTAVAKGAAFTLLGAPMKIGLATLVVGLATGAALYLPTSGGAPEAPRAQEAARIATPVPRTPHAGASSDDAPPAAEASAPAEPSATPAAASSKRAPASRPAPAAAAAAARPGGGGLDAEIALLRDAQQALQAGQFAQALSKLNEHASRYPRGVLSTEREASRAIALCRSGRAASGKAIAAKLLAQSPGSPLATRVRAACGQEE